MLLAVLNQATCSMHPSRVTECELVLPACHRTADDTKMYRTECDALGWSARIHLMAHSGAKHAQQLTAYVNVQEIPGQAPHLPVRRPHGVSVAGAVDIATDEVA